MKDRIIIIVNQNKIIGQGHVSRMISLSQILINSFNIFFYSIIENKLLERKVKEEGVKIIKPSLKNRIDYLVNKNDIIVIDDYDFKDFKNLKNKVKKIILIDDFGRKYKDCDYIINHSLEKRKKKFPKKYFYGFSYTLIRKKFLLNKENLNYYSSKNRSLIICMGSSDPNNITMKILKYCISSNYFNVINIITTSKFLIKSIKKLNLKANINFCYNLNEDEIINLTLNSNLAITTSSTIALEMCSINIPLICGYMIDNQKLLLENLKYKNCAISIEDLNNVNENILTKSIKETLSKKKILMNNQFKYFGNNSNDKILNIFNSC